MTRSAVATSFVHPHGRVDAEREVRARAATAGQRLLRALAYGPALLGVQIGRDDAVTQTGEAVELRGEQLAAVARRDQHRRPCGVPRQRADRVLDQLVVRAAVGHRLTAPEHPPGLDVLFQPPDAPLVVGAARRPLALRRRQAPAHAEPEHQTAVRDLVHVGDLLRQHDRVAERRQQHGRAQAHARRDAGDVRQRRQRLQPRLGDDAVADPDRVVAGSIGQTSHGPAFVDRWTPCRLHDRTARGNEDADAHGLVV